MNLLLNLPSTFFPFGNGLPQRSALLLPLRNLLFFVERARAKIWQAMPFPNRLQRNHTRLETLNLAVGGFHDMEAIDHNHASTCTCTLAPSFPSRCRFNPPQLLWHDLRDRECRGSKGNNGIQHFENGQSLENKAHDSSSYSSNARPRQRPLCLLHTPHRLKCMLDSPIRSPSLSTTTLPPQY